MQRRIRRLAPALALLLASPPALRAQEIDTLALRAHTRVLADDLLEGRGTGTRGERLAALYIASQLERLGIEGAAPDGGFHQPVPLREATIDAAATRLVVRRDGGISTFRTTDHFIVNLGGRRAFRDFAGEALFAGTTGLARAALAKHERLDGQVIVLIGSLGDDAGAIVTDWTRRGAAGVVSLVPDPRRFDVFVRSRGNSRLFVDADVDDPYWQPELPILVAGPELAAAILADAPLAPDALNGRQPFDALPLGRRIEATIRVGLRDVPAANIAARIPGRDPARRDEIVIFTAHYDHLGIGTPDANGDSIYNGFSDNAAGAAMLLAIAESLARTPPDRSVLFLFVTGEERGLLGSSYYAAEPLIPLDRTVAVVNLDAGAPPAPPRTWRIAGGTASTLGELAARVAAEQGWTAEPSDASPNSDHWPFLRRGVPAVFVIPGQEWDGVSRDEREALHQRWDHYHRPDDEWAPDFPFHGLRRYAELALAIGRAAANAAEPPQPARPPTGR